MAAKAQAIGRSRGGWTTKVHALTDVIGRPYALLLMPGYVADVKAAPELLARMAAPATWPPTTTTKPIRSEAKDSVPSA